MSRAVKVFGDGSGELFGTVRALDEFTGALAANDAAVSRFMGDLGAVSQQLAGEKDELAAALSNLAGVLGKVERFVQGQPRAARQGRRGPHHDPRGRWPTERTALETVLDIGPAAMGNLHIAFDPESGSIGSRLNVKGNVQDLDDLLCSLVRRRPTSRPPTQACELFKALLEPVEGQVEHPGVRPRARPRPPGGTTAGAVRRRPAGPLACPSCWEVPHEAPDASRRSCAAVVLRARRSAAARPTTSRFPAARSTRTTPSR